MRSVPPGQRCSHLCAGFPEQPIRSLSLLFLPISYLLDGIRSCRLADPSTAFRLEAGDSRKEHYGSDDTIDRGAAPRDLAYRMAFTLAAAVDLRHHTHKLRIVCYDTICNLVQSHSASRCEQTTSLPPIHTASHHPTTPTAIGSIAPMTVMLSLLSSSHGHASGEAPNSPFRFTRNIRASRPGTPPQIAQERTAISSRVAVSK